MSIDEKKEKIINYIQNYSKTNGNPPTIKSICDNIPEINRSNFYKIFPEGLGEACIIAKIPVPEKRIKSTAKANRSRKTQKLELPQIMIDEKTSAQIQTISYIEKMSPQEVIEELIENDRILKKNYHVQIRDISRLAIFLKACEQKNVNQNRIINSLITFTNLRLDLLPKGNFDLLINLWNDIKKNYWTFEDIKALYIDRQDAYQKGYTDFNDNVTPTIIEEIGKNYHFNSIPRNEVFKLGFNVSLSLLKKRMNL